MKLTKENCVASYADNEKQNVYITHPSAKVMIRLYATIAELQEDSEWRERVALRNGEEGSLYAVLAKTKLIELDV